MDGADDDDIANESWMVTDDITIDPHSATQEWVTEYAAYKADCAKAISKEPHRVYWKKGDGYGT